MSVIVGGAGGADGVGDVDAVAALHAACCEHVAAEMAACGHLWQRDPFALHVVDRYNSVGRHLYGRTAFGDNIEVLARRCAATL